MKNYLTPDGTVHAFDDDYDGPLIPKDGKIVKGKALDDARAAFQSKVIASTREDLDYAGLRRLAYPPISDGLDAMVKGGQAWENYKAACLKVKADFPKPA